MEERDWLARRFEEQRGPVCERWPTGCSARSATRTTLSRRRGCGSAARTASEIDNLGAWLTTVVARLSLSMLRARKTRREEPLGVHMPEPILDRADGIGPRAPGAARGLGRPGPARRARVAEPRPSGSRSCCTTSSPCRSPRSPRSSTAHPRRLASSRAAHAAASGAAARRPSTTSTPSARSSRRSSRPRATATSRRWSPCSTRTSCCAPTSVPLRGSQGGPRSGGRRRPGGRLLAARPARRSRPRSTAPPGAVSTLDGQPFSIGGFTIRGGKIVEMDIIADPERLRASST